MELTLLLLEAEKFKIKALDWNPLAAPANGLVGETISLGSASIKKVLYWLGLEPQQRCWLGPSFRVWNLSTFAVTGHLTSLNINFYCYKMELTVTLASKQLDHMRMQMSKYSIDYNTIEIWSTSWLLLLLKFLRVGSNSDGDWLFKTDQETMFTLKAIISFSLNITHLFNSEWFTFCHMNQEPIAIFWMFIFPKNSCWNPNSQGDSIRRY